MDFSGDEHPKSVFSERKFLDSLSQDVTVKRTFVWHIGDEAWYNGEKVVIFNLYKFEGSQYADVALRLNRTVRTAVDLSRLLPFDERK